MKNKPHQIISDSTIESIGQCSKALEALHVLDINLDLLNIKSEDFIQVKPLLESISVRVELALKGCVIEKPQFPSDISTKNQEG